MNIWLLRTSEPMPVVDKDGRMFEDRRKTKTDRRKKQIPVEHDRRKSDRRKENNKTRK